MPRLNYRCVIIVLSALTLFASVAQAATSITHQDGPRYTPGSAQYVFGVCADTASGESAYAQYTTDGSLPGDPPQTGNGSRNVCMLTNDPSCASGRYWLCALPDVRGATIWYRFYLLNTGGQFTGLMTPTESFYTGSTAVTQRELSAAPASTGITPLVGVAAAVVAALAVTIVRLRQARR